MVISLNKFLSSDDISYKISKDFVVDDKDFLKETHLNELIIFNGDFFKVEDSILLNGIIKYTIKENCARCLSEFERTVETKFEAVILKKQDDAYDDESDDVKLIVEDGCVDLKETIKQYVYLSLPMKSVCKADCKGICPTCGVNLNIEECQCQNNSTDPRFNKLKALLKD